MAIKHNKVSAVSDSGDTSLVQPSDWNDSHDIDNSGLALPVVNDALANPANTVVIGAGQTAGCVRLKYRASNETNFTGIQGSLIQREFRAAIPTNGDVTVTAIGCNITKVGTAAARFANSTSLLNASTRAGQVSAATAGAFAGYRSNAAMLLPPGVSVGTGYRLQMLFGITDTGTVSGARMFCGATPVGVATNVEPSALVNSVGIAQLSTDATQLYLVYGGTTAQTPIPLGTDFPVTPGKWYYLELYARYGTVESIDVMLRNLTEDKTYATQLTGDATQIPLVNLAVNLWRCNNATTQAVALDFGGWQVEKDLPI